MRSANLLPEAQWEQCPRCKAAVPTFKFAAPFEAEIQNLLKNSPAQAMARVAEEAQCNMSLAKA